MRFRCFGVRAIAAALVVAGAGAASAQTYQRTYTYDALGRLTSMQYTPGISGAGQQTNYTYDAAGNRTGLTVNTAALLSTQTLAAGQYLKSVDGAYQLLMQSQDGNLVLYGPNGATWSSQTQGHAGAYAQITSAGVLTVYAPQGNVLWVSNNFEGSGGHLLMQTDGNLIIYDANGAARWASKNASVTQADRLQSGQSLIQGEQLVSQGGTWLLQLQNSGTLAIVCARTQAVLATVLSNSTLNYVQMGSNGYMWANASSGNIWPNNYLNTPVAGAYLVMQSDGNLVAYNPASAGGAAIWASGTGGHSTC